MGQRPKSKTLDRIDNNKGYNKENCKWSTPLEQQHNRRMGNNNSSGYVGVYHVNNKYTACVFVNSKTVSLGVYDNIDDAIKARIKGEKKYYN